MAFTARLNVEVQAEAQAYADRIGISLNALLSVALQDYLVPRRSPTSVEPSHSGEILSGERSSTPGTSYPLDRHETRRQGFAALRRVEEEHVRAVAMEPLLYAGTNPRHKCPCGSGKLYPRCHGRRRG